MEHFTGLEFIAWTHRPVCNAWVDKIFDYYVLDYAESGNLLMQIDDEPALRLKGPVVFLTFPGPHFKFGRHIGHWDHRFVSFKGALAEHFAKTGLFPAETPILKISNPERFSRAFDKLLEYMDAPEYGVLRGVHLLEGLLLQLHEQISPPVKPRVDPRISRTLEKITAKPEQNWDLPQLATQSGVSYPHFRRLFLAAAGIPPGSFILAKRMEKAGRLLQRPSPPSLQETASLCGYEDIYHFNKSFRKFHGIAPGRYRDNFQLK